MRVNAMRTAIALLSTLFVALLLTATDPAQAQTRRAWCLQAGDSGNLECAFSTLKQCQQARSGASTTSTCLRNQRRARSGK
jgi:hypothetical protein